MNQIWPVVWRHATDERNWVKAILITSSLLFLTLVLFVPLAAIFAEAFRRAAVYFASFTDPNALSAIRLTLLVSAICVPLNLVFGLAASWAIAKFQFPGKSILITLIDLPFAVSPVISGLIFVLLFGMRGWLGPWLDEHNIQIIFRRPRRRVGDTVRHVSIRCSGSHPLDARAGQRRGAGRRVAGRQRLANILCVTLPNVKWALLYGVILCNARAMGEFGAVNVVSGHMRGKTNTLPLHVEILYNEYNFVAAFAVASLLALLALVTLAAKSIVEWRVRREYEQALEPTRAEE